MGKGKILVMGSNAARIEIQGGGTGPTGQYLNETVVSDRDISWLG